ERDGDRDTMTSDELARPVEARSESCDDWLAMQIPEQLIAQRCGSLISVARIGVQRCRQKGVEVAAQLLAQRTGRQVGSARHATRECCPDTIGTCPDGRQRMAPDEQHVKKHAELIDISGSGGELAEELLRRGVLRCEHDLVDERARRIVTFRPLRADQLRDAEVEQLDRAATSDEHVGWLEIAMYDQVAVRMGDREHGVHEQTNTRLDIEVLGVAVAIDAVAVDVLEYQELPAVGGRAGIEQPCDIRVCESREQAAFTAKALRQLLLRDGAIQK